MKNGVLQHLQLNDGYIPVVHVWGTAYEKGFAHGELMKERLTGFFDTTWTYIQNQVERAINGSSSTIDPATAKWIAENGLKFVFDVTSDWTKPYTGQWFFDEMRGIADASGVDYDQIRRIHMIGELTKGACSMFGAWGTALPPIEGWDSRLLSMRALDWNIDGPFKDFPQLTVYHAYNASKENSFINVGWTGWVGSITGVNDKRVSIHEIGASFPDETFGEESRQGVPFTHVLRDILQFDRSALDGASRLASSKRTCNLILGVGSGGDPTSTRPDGSPGTRPRFFGVQYSASVCHIMDDTNLLPAADWHPKIDNVVYYGMDWNCPSYNSWMAKALKGLHGKLTPEAAIRDVMSIVQTGDLQIFLTDLSANRFKGYLSIARQKGQGGALMAYDRPYVEVDLLSLFNTQRP